MTTLALPAQPTPQAPQPGARQTVSFTQQDRSALASLLGEQGPAGAATDVIRAFALGHPHIGCLVNAAYAQAGSLVHLEQEVTLGTPLQPDTAYAVRAALAGARPQRDDTVAGLSCPLHDPMTGALVASLTGSALLAGVQPVGAEPPAARRPAAAPLTPPAEVRVPVTVQRDFVATYADLAGDHNPIHLDPVAARAAGFDDCIAHGMSLVGLAVARAGASVTSIAATQDNTRIADTARVVGVGVRFAQPAIVGDEVTIVLQATVDPKELGLSASSARGPVLKAAWIRFDRPITLRGASSPGSLR